MTRTSRFPAVAKRRQPEQLGSGRAALIIGSLLVAAAVSFQSPAHSTPLDVGTPAEAAAALAATNGHGSAAKIAELEKGFWVCDYIGTTRGTEGPYGVTCGANFEELKQTKFGGDFDALVQWWSVNKAAQHAALGSAISAQF
ncbi:MAG: hypothetical protein ACXW16_01210 [Burkholderiaceae bacterium]